jgi:predicted metal-dependent peptidase
VNEKEVMVAAEQAYELFLTKHKVDVYLEFIDEEEFFDLSEKSKIISEEMKEGLPIKVGSLVAHSKDKETIILCINILNFLTKNLDFVKALVLHELYHILYRKKINKTDKVNSFFISEERVHEHFKQEFPNYARILEI